MPIKKLHPSRKTEYQPDLASHWLSSLIFSRWRFRYENMEYADFKASLELLKINDYASPVWRLSQKFKKSARLIRLGYVDARRKFRSNSGLL